MTHVKVTLQLQGAWRSVCSRSWESEQTASRAGGERRPFPLWGCDVVGERQTFFLRSGTVQVERRRQGGKVLRCWKRINVGWIYQDACLGKLRRGWVPAGNTPSLPKHSVERPAALVGRKDACPLQRPFQTALELSDQHSQVQSRGPCTKIHILLRVTVQ